MIIGIKKIIRMTIPECLMRYNAEYSPHEEGNGKYAYRHEAVRDGFGSYNQHHFFLQAIYMIIIHRKEQASLNSV